MTPPSCFFSVSATLLALVSSTTMEARSQEWTRFRGPNGSGIGKITALPAEFTTADYEWAAKLDGVGHSSPVLWGEKIFVTLAAPGGEWRRVECYEATSGNCLWNHEAKIATHNLHKYNNFASSTPVATESAVFVVWGSGDRTEVLALDHSGKELWSRQWPAFSSDHGFGSSPVVAGGLLILHTDSVEEKRSTVMGLDPKTGETVWELVRETAAGEEKHLTAYNTPTVVVEGGRETLVVFQTNDGWKGLAPATGEVEWALDEGYDLRSVGSIVSGDGIVFATTGSGGNGKQATALRPNANGAPDILFELGIKDGLGYVPTPLIHEGLLYLWGDTGMLAVRDAKTGEEVYRERVNGNFFSSPVIADGKIYCGSRDGELVAIAPGRKFDILGRSRLESGMNATPAIALNRMFLRTDTHLISVKGR